MPIRADNFARSLCLSAITLIAVAGCKSSTAPAPVDESLPAAQRASLMEADRMINQGEDMKAEGEKMKAEGQDGDAQIRQGEQMIADGEKMKQDAMMMNP